MENFSTVGARFVMGALFSLTLAGAARADTCAFRPDAPDRHLVVKGDTLWDISGRFLEHPWCWGQVWGMNRDEIRNPHWIYPGQIVYFDRLNGRLRLGTPLGDSAAPLSDDRLRPQVRTAALGRDAVPAIDASIIEPFLSQPLIIDEDQLAGAPRIVATQENRLFLGRGDKAYVRGNLNGGSAFQVFRPAQPLKDPVTQQVLGYEAFYLGSINLQSAARAGADVHTFTVGSASQEMGAGNYLVASKPVPFVNYVPHPPAQKVGARVMSVYGGVAQAGQNQIVTVNRGSVDGLDVGAVLQLYHEGQTVVDPTASTSWLSFSSPKVKLPDEQYGTLFVFRVFKRISYGLIMQVTQPVQIGDAANSPE